jgi:3-deoxy-D-manno-octulosonate 8-phosphate phosphatase (KDO 8-P phosphatase)
MRCGRWRDCGAYGMGIAEITVPHASPEIRKSVDYITQRDGGHGAVREIVDMIRHSRGFTPEIAMID